LKNAHQASLISISGGSVRSSTPPALAHSGGRPVVIPPSELEVFWNIFQRLTALLSLS
jgi:hypothetical protein